MAEYIEREAAKRLLVSDYAYAAADLLDKVPTADVVEVVRCKKCRFRKCAVESEGGVLVCLQSGMEIRKNDFCSYGKRRDSDGND